MRHVYRPAIFWPLAGTTTVQTVTAMMFLTVPVLAPAMADDVGFQPSHVGLYTALVFLGAMPVSLVIGALTSRFGALRVMQVGMVLSACSLAASTSGILTLVWPAAWCWALAMARTRGAPRTSWPALQNQKSWRWYFP